MECRGRGTSASWRAAVPLPHLAASGRLRLVARPSSGELAATPTWAPRALHCACRRVFDTGQCALEGLRHRWRLVECFRGQLNAISTARGGQSSFEGKGRRSRSALRAPAPTRPDLLAPPHRLVAQGAVGFLLV